MLALKGLYNGRMAKFYVTTAIPYVNAPPHIGHAVEYVQADVVARWHRLIGDETFFLVGTDENTLKLIQAAEKEKTEPRALADKYVAVFVDLWQRYQISHDYVIRTTDEVRHHPGAQKLWQALSDNGYIYKGTYEGWYCVGCEQFYTEKEIIDGTCPTHGTVLEKRSEENYLFKLSAFGEQIERILTDGTCQLVPESRRNEVVSFVRQGLSDISFSRPAERLRMGVPVPGDETQTMYVWVDALANYVTGIGYGRDEELFDRWWPADLQVIGKDITRFHAVYWPAMLLGAGLPLPKKLYAHGFMTVEGEKMSKSKGNVIDPFDLAEVHGVDAIRYYLLHSLPYASDGDYSEHHFTEIYEAHLANDFGNLVSRVLAMVTKTGDGQAPKGTHDRKLAEHVGQTWERLKFLFDEGRFSEAIDAVHQLTVAANRFIEQKQPYKQEGQDQADTLTTLLQVLGHLSLLYEPFIPEAAGKLQERLGLTAKPASWTEAIAFEKVPAGTAVNKGESLFPKS